MSENFEAAKQTFVLGVSAFEVGDFARAEALFLDALRLLPGRPSTLVNLAATRQRLGRPAEALVSLDQALAAQPDDAPAWYQRGQLLQELERPIEALAAYERVLAIEPAQGAAWSQRGSLLKDMGRLAEAAECFRSALAHGADGELNRYYLASVEAAAASADGARSTAAAGTEAPASAPRRYVEALFDSYAEGFDEHLVGKLGYRTPWLIAEMLLGTQAITRPDSPAPPATANEAPNEEPNEGPPAAPPSRKRWRAALDLGCGTGLMGPLLAPHCGTLDGVDLSSQMLAKAQALGCYRQLEHGDIADHLHATAERHDLLVAADVFVYIGELERVFAGARRVLEAGGWFAFSLEEAAAASGRFELRASSRYAHSERYVLALAAAQGFVVRKLERTPLRHEQRQPIGGLLVLLQRS